MRDASRTQKRKEKIGLKLGLGKCGKTKVFLSLLLWYILFQIVLKI